MENLDQIIALRALMREVRPDGGTITGTVTVDPHVLQLLDGLADAGLIIRKSDQICTPESLKANDVVQVSLETAALNYYERFADYLAHFPDHRPAGRFRIHELAFTSDATPEPELFQCYQGVLRLWALLRRLCDHQDNRRVFLLSTDKLEIDCIYSTADLVPLAKLDELEADFADNAACRTEKRTLFKRALLEDLSRCPPEERLACLLKNFTSIYDRYWQNYRLFLEGISFEKIFESYVEKHSKLIAEFNSVLGGIQTALIGLPIASFVILEKMTVANHLTFKNTLLMIGCIVFIGFLTLLSVSQGRTLAASKALADELKNDVGSKNPDLAKRLTPSLLRLSRQAQWVTWLLITVRILLAGLVFVTAITYLYVSVVPFRTWLNGLLQACSM
jgi:hypothetical protein